MFYKATGWFICETNTTTQDISHLPAGNVVQASHVMHDANVMQACNVMQAGNVMQDANVMQAGNALC